MMREANLRESVARETLAATPRPPGGFQFVAGHGADKQITIVNNIEREPGTRGIEAQPAGTRLSEAHARLHTHRRLVLVGDQVPLVCILHDVRVPHRTPPANRRFGRKSVAKHGG